MRKIIFLILILLSINCYDDNERYEYTVKYEITGKILEDYGRVDLMYLDAYQRTVLDYNVTLPYNMSFKTKKTCNFIFLYTELFPNGTLHLKIFVDNNLVDESFGEYNGNTVIARASSLVNEQECYNNY